MESSCDDAQHPWGTVSAQEASALALKVFVLWLLHREVSWRVWGGYAGRVGGTSALLGLSRAGLATFLLVVRLNQTKSMGNNGYSEANFLFSQK